MCGIRRSRKYVGIVERLIIWLNNVIFFVVLIARNRVISLMIVICLVFVYFGKSLITCWLSVFLFCLVRMYRFLGKKVMLRRGLMIVSLKRR